MDKKEKLKLQLAIDQADTWVRQYNHATNERSSIRTTAAQSLKNLRSKLIAVEVAGQTFQILPLGPTDTSDLAKFARFIQLAPISSHDTELLHQLETEIPRAQVDAQKLISSGLGARRNTEDIAEGAEYLLDYVTWGLGAGVSAALERISPSDTSPPVNLNDALNPGLGLGNALKQYGTPELLPAAEVRSRLATFSAAERYPELARAITPAHDYLVVCSPPGHNAAELKSALELDN